MVRPVATAPTLTFRAKTRRSPRTNSHDMLATRSSEFGLRLCGEERTAARVAAWASQFTTPAHDEHGRRDEAAKAAGHDVGGDHGRDHDPRTDRERDRRGCDQAEADRGSED